MNACSPFLPQGINTACLAEVKEIKNVIITTTAVSFANTLATQTLSGWKTKVQTDLTVFPPMGLNDFENTTDDPAISTLQSTRKIVTNKPIPSFVFYLASNFCDYRDMVAAFQGGNYRIFFVDGHGNLIGTRGATGAVQGFSCQISAVMKLPLKGDIQNSYKIYVNCQSYEEWENACIVGLNWNPTVELTTFMPVGLTLFATGAITAGSIGVQVTARCGDGMTGLVAADWEVVESSNLVTPGIATCTEVSNGAYTLALKKSTSTPLAAGDMVTIRVKKVTATVVNYLSNRLTINALA
jgi:hypothetical protein